MFKRMAMLARAVIIAGAALAVTILTASPVCAQSEQEPASANERRPFRGIFNAPSDPNSPQSLVLSASAFAAYDNNVLQALSTRRVSSPWLQGSGTYQGATAGLGYTFNRTGERVSFRGNSGAQLRYNRSGDDSNALPSYQGGVSTDLRLSRSLTFGASQSVTYTSNYNNSLTPGPDEAGGDDIAPVPDSVFDLFDLQALRAATSLTLSQQFGRNTELAVGYSFRLVDIKGDAPRDSRFRDYRTQAGSLGLKHTRPLSRNAALDLGYGIRVTDQRSLNGEPRVMHNVIASVNYSRALSFSRRTSFTFGSGSAIAVSDRVEDAPDGEPRTLPRLTANVALIHEMGRTWTAQVGYVRGFRTRDGFDDLYFTDGVSTQVGGLVTRRLSFSAAGQWSTSSLARERRTGNRGVAASSRATYGLSRYLGLFASYVYYKYRYDEEVRLDPRLPRALDRQGVRVGLTASLPIF
jgi:hypothetical protein